MSTLWAYGGCVCERCVLLNGLRTFVSEYLALLGLNVSSAEGRSLASQQQGRVSGVSPSRVTARWHQKTGFLGAFGAERAV